MATAQQHRRFVSLSCLLQLATAADKVQRALLQRQAGEAEEVLPSAAAAAPRTACRLWWTERQLPLLAGDTDTATFNLQVTNRAAATADGNRFHPSAPGSYACTEVIGPVACPATWLPLPALADLPPRGQR